MKRKVWRTHKAGAIDRLQLEADTLGDLPAEQVRINVKSIGLNFADIFAITGLYSATPKGSFVPGLEFSGEVIESRSEVFKVGDKVMGVTRFGGYSSVIDSPAHYLTALPESWSYQQGAAYLVQTLTAYYALTELGNIKAKQTVLIHSAAGGVGLQAMKLVTAMGGQPVGTVSSEHKAAYLKEQGFNQVLVRDASFRKQLQQSGLLFDLVLDGVGGEVQKASFDCLSPMGRLIVFGAAEFTPGKNRPNYISTIFKYLKRPKYDVMDMISDNKSVMAFNLIWLWEQVGYLTKLMKDMQTIEISAPHVGHAFAFADAKAAIECLREGNTIGKVVLNV
ncbi:zinc-binding dehydrogenase [Bermanella sp. R86510]|uniref:zinc-binding dehydrogenase n=1 Tax=unclassified Bermanella TaxID=2627862 RepID=UPI0037C8C188